MSFKTASYISIANRGLNPVISLALTRSVANPVGILRGLNISPSFSGKSFWNFAVDGALNITSGSYTLTPTDNFTASIKMWGQGGYNNGSYSGGAGAALTGTLVFTNGASMYVTFGGGGTGGATGTPGNGGNYSGIFTGSSASHGNTVAIAGAGGGSALDDGGRGANGGAGGFPAGSASSGYAGATAGGGSQSAGGSGGSGSAGNGSSGSALNGGNGGGSGNCIGGGGGGGYYGGGGAGCVCCDAGAGGGGGSSYNSSNTSLITSVTHYSGSGTTVGNTSDSDRNGAGASNGGTGRVYILAS